MLETPETVNQVQVDIDTFGEDLSQGSKFHTVKNAIITID